MSEQFAIIPAVVLKDAQLSDKQLRLLCVLSTYANREGWCYPKQNTLAKDCQCSDRQIRRDIQRLIDLGYVTVHPQYNSTHLRVRNLYRIRYDMPIGHVRPIDRTPVSGLDRTPLSGLDRTPVSGHITESILTESILTKKDVEKIDKKDSYVSAERIAEIRRNLGLKIV